MSSRLYSLNNVKLYFQQRVLIQGGYLTASYLISKDEAIAGPHVKGIIRWKLTLKSKQRGQEL